MAAGIRLRGYGLRNSNPSPCLIFILMLSFSSQNVLGAAKDYVDMYLSNPDICPPVSKFLGFSTGLTNQKIRLGNLENFATILRLTPQEGPSTSFFNFKCKFQVTAPPGYAVMVVVRSLSLRTQGKDCLDFVQFKREGTYKTREICGDVQADDKSDQPENLLGPRYFNDFSGAMDVTFSSGKYNPANSNLFPISLELVFTAFTKCPISQKDKDKMGHCSDTACMNKGLMCDSVINCPSYPDNPGSDTYGEDEKDCPETPGGTSRAMTVFIFALTAVGTLLIVVGVVLCTCCFLRRLHHWKRYDQDDPPNDEFNLSRRGSQTTPPLSPTAPLPLTDVEFRSATPNAPRLDDLPPSYKDLFPESRTTRISAKI